MSAMPEQHMMTTSPDPERASFIRVRNLTKTFGGFVAVDDVSVAAAKGGTLALLGPSGCGKTTILRCIAGLETPNAGTIEIGGRVAFDSARGIDLAPEERDLGIVFQSYAIWPHMTVAANVGFPLKVRGTPRKAIAERVDRILSIVGLANWRDRSAIDLSGGQQQRVALARALIHEPSVVLFDEPMSNLDAQLRDHMRLELKMLQQELNFTAIYVTHDQAEAFGLAQCVAVMNRGRIETIGTPREVVQRPKSAFIARFLGYNVIAGTVVAVRPCTGDGKAGAGEHLVQIALGDRFKVWGVVGREGPHDPGSSVVLCVRRERVGIVEPAGAGPADHPAHSPNEPVERQRYAGLIRASSFQGHHQEYIADVDGISLRAIGEPSGIEDRSTVMVTLDCYDCLVLPSADG